MEELNDREIDERKLEAYEANKREPSVIVHSSGNSFWKHLPENLMYLKQQLVGKPVPQIRYDRKKGLFTIQVSFFDHRSTTPSDRRF